MSLSRYYWIPMSKSFLRISRALILPVLAVTEMSERVEELEKAV